LARNQHPPARTACRPIAANASRVRLRRLLDVGAESLVLFLYLGDIPLGHLVAARDQVHEHSEERQDDHEDQFT